MKRTKAVAIAKILQTLINIGEVSIILNTFVAAFRHKSITKNDGRNYLHGNFNLGGTVSGRLSSSKVNLQNLPSTGSKYAKDIKRCFKAPEGWLFAGADFASLEDRISALTTHDPNKLRVYEDGYDGHCLRAFSYFGKQMLDITFDCAGINSIEDKYPKLRQQSKGPTFLLTYGGTWHGLVNNLGFTPEEAKEIEKKYHELYQVSDQWVKDKITLAASQGYIDVAFGLRVRTPILKQVLLNRSGTPYEAMAEARTAGNALGQSYGLLNNRAAIEMQERVLASEYKYDIKPIAHIHDSQYFLIRNTVGCVKWFNDNLIECMEWTNMKELEHPTVGLGGAVELYFPTWANKAKLPNKATKQEILAICASKA